MSAMEKVEYIKKEDYKKIIYENDFGFKNKIRLLKDGFNHLGVGIFSLFISFLLWSIIFVVGISVLDYIFTKNWFEINLKVMFQTQDMMDYIMSWQFFVILILVYNSQQLFITNNIFLKEKINKDNYFLGAFGLFVRQTPLLIKTSLILGTILFCVVYVLGILYLYLTNNGKLDLLEQFFTLKGLGIALLIFSCLLVLYFTMLGTILIYISDNLNPLKINIFKKEYRAFVKVFKMFDLIIPTLMGNIFLLTVISLMMVSLGLNLFDYYQEKFIKPEMTEMVKEITRNQVIVGVLLLVLPLFGLLQVIVNKARIRSLSLIFFMTEDQEEYDDRLTYPIKK